MDRNSYIGYIQVDDTDNYLMYEIKAYTYKAARIRIKRIANGLTTRTTQDHSVAWLGEHNSVLPAEIVYGVITNQGQTVV